MVYSWRVGYKIRIDYDNIVEERAIICVAWKWQGEREVHSLNWKKRGDDKQLLKEFIPIVESADEVVAHNGDKFDVPWLKARAAYHRIPITPYIKTVDTKAQSARNFYFNSNRLDYLGQFLGVGRKIETDFDLWKDVMAGDERALARMIRYNKQDVRLLEQVFLALEDYNKHKTHVGVLKGGDRTDCPRCASSRSRKRGTSVTAAGFRKQEWGCTDCGKRWQTPAGTIA